MTTEKRKLMLVYEDNAMCSTPQVPRYVCFKQQSYVFKPIEKGLKKSHLCCLKFFMP